MKSLSATGRRGGPMVQSQCPVCFTSLVVRDVTPCYICGGWPEMVEQFDGSAGFREWRLPAGPRIVLCQGCELEEFMVPGGWGNRLGLPARRLPINTLQLVQDLPAPALGKDKFCSQCNLRLAFLKIVASLAAQTGVGPTPDRPT